MAEGIRKRHTKKCPARTGGGCRCDGGYEASVYSERDGKKLYKTFRREAEARSWRADTKRSLDRGASGRREAERSEKLARHGWRVPSGARFATAPAVPSSPLACAATDKASPTESSRL
jgi:hypothetical protein